MKLRDYFDEPTKKKLKKRNWNEVIQDDILPTFEKPKYVVETSIGFGLSKMQLKKVFDYIKSWFIRYNISYEAINPYLTVSTVEGNYKRHDFINELKGIREFCDFKPKGVFILREDEKDFIIIEYDKNSKFTKHLNKTISNFSLAKTEEVCYVKLFSMDRKSFPLKLFDDMIYSMPDLPKVDLGNVGLLVRRK